jgi:hypothetical protein
MTCLSGTIHRHAILAGQLSIYLLAFYKNEFPLATLTKYNPEFSDRKYVDS